VRAQAAAAAFLTAGLLPAVLTDRASITILALGLVFAMIADRRTSTVFTAGFLSVVLAVGGATTLSAGRALFGMFAEQYLPAPDAYPAGRM